MAYDRPTLTYGGLTFHTISCSYTEKGSVVRVRPVMSASVSIPWLKTATQANLSKVGRYFGACPD